MSEMNGDGNIQSKLDKDRMSARKSWPPIVSREDGGMNTLTLNRKYQRALDGNAIDSGIFEALKRRSPIGGRCGAGAHSFDDQSWSSSYIKRGVFLVVTLLGCLVLASAAQAASFDCGKAQTKVEHLICDNPELSKLHNRGQTTVFHL
jgi:hypothetical protein